MNKSQTDWVDHCRGYKAFLSSLRSCFGEKPSLKMRERHERDGEMQNGFTRRKEGGVGLKKKKKERGWVIGFQTILAQVLMSIFYTHFILCFVCYFVVFIYK